VAGLVALVAGLVAGPRSEPATAVPADIVTASAAAALTASARWSRERVERVMGVSLGTWHWRWVAATYPQRSAPG
jgi:hypothetical protein